MHFKWSSSGPHHGAAARYNLGPVLVFLLAFLVMEWGTVAISATTASRGRSGGGASARGLAVGAWDLSRGGIPLVRR